jgi:DNA-binding transcriptional regulator YiaG
MANVSPQRKQHIRQVLKGTHAAVPGKPTRAWGKAHSPEPATIQDAKAARKAVNLSQPAFAQALGVSPATVRSWEQGQRRPDGVASLVLKALKTSPALLQMLHKPTKTDSLKVGN